MSRLNCSGVVRLQDNIEVMFMNKEHKKALYSFPINEFKEKIHPFNQMIMEQFLEQQHLSDYTLKQYRSALMIFFTFVYQRCMNKPLYELKPRDALSFQNYLIASGLSPNAVKFKRSAVSSLCSFLELYYADEYPNFRNIFNKAIPSIPKTNVKEKNPLTSQEIEYLLQELEKREEWQKIAYVLFTYSTGCRKRESCQLLKEVITYDKYVDKRGNQKNFYVTHPIRAKGRGKEGKVRRFQFNERAMQAIKKWIEYRQTLVEVDDCPYVFVSKRNGKFKQIHPDTFNVWCEEFSEILGKPVFPHLFRSSRATISVVEEGKDIKAVQKLLGHESSQTTEIYVVRDDEDDLDELFD